MNERHDDLQEIIDAALREMAAEEGDGFDPQACNLAEFCRRTGLTRSRARTVRAHGFRALPHGNSGRRAAPGVLAGHTGLVDDLLRKGVTNSQVIFERLLGQGYAGGLTTVKTYIAAHRDLVPAKRRQAAPQGCRGQRFRTAPGEAYQMDWGFVAVERPGGERARIACLLASIYFSPVSLNRRTVRAKAVSPVALTYFHRFRSRLDGPVPRQVLQPVGPAGYLDQVAVVAHPVRDRARRHVVPEHPAPAADPHVGGDDRRALLVARRYQLEQQVRARAADIEVAELVDDQQPRVGVVLEPLLEDAARRGVLQVLDEPGAVHEPDLAPRPDGLDAQRDGEVRLAHAGAPHEQDVLGPLDEPQGRELLDLGARDRRLEVPVEVRQPLDVGEPRRPYALVGDPDLPGGDLDARHLLEGGGEAPLARGDHPHVVGQGRRHLVQPERGEVRLRPDRGAALRDGAHHAPPSESSSARLARAASAMSASARPRFPSRACP